MATSKKPVTTEAVTHQSTASSTSSNPFADSTIRKVNANGSNSDLLTVKEAAAFLRCSKSYLDKLRCTGGGPEFVRLSPRKIIYHSRDLSNWAKARRFDSTSQYDE